MRADGNSVLCWDLGRYMNHSCEPASRGVGESFEVAVRDIHPGDELTCEYGSLNLVDPLVCRCGAATCRGLIRRDDPVRYHERWDAEATAAFALSSTVGQPLLPYAKLDPADRTLLDALRTGAAVVLPSALGYHLAGDFDVIHPATRLVTIDPHVGRGVVATRPIPRGTITWVLDALDQAFAAADVAGLPSCYEPLIDRWTYNDGRGHHVLCWDISRFMNHSCEPTCGGSEHGFELALRDIGPGEQLTNDYATFHLRPQEWFACHCGRRTCPGVVSHQHGPSSSAQVRRWVQAASVAIERVEQPLADLLPPGRLSIGAGRTPRRRRVDPERPAVRAGYRFCGPSWPNPPRPPPPHRAATPARVVGRRTRHDAGCALGAPPVGCGTVPEGSAPAQIGRFG